MNLDYLGELFVHRGNSACTFVPTPVLELQKPKLSWATLSAEIQAPEAIPPFSLAFTSLAAER